ncbi:50S ribosomal protein L4 [Candidatus Micrarchaeota archaeon]|nr:MAG: 50S ribosomal protein L4 [Candidatus Micrarchaeota archaeon]
MKAKVYSLDGQVKKEIELPKVFNESVRDDLIRRAVHALQTHRLQPKGSYPLAGLQTSAEYIGRRRAFRSGATRGISRLPREKLGGGGLGEVKRVPHAKGGRRAHPPKVERIIYEKINKKERKKALASAVAATGKLELVKERGHKVDEKKGLPLIIESGIETVKKSKDALNVLLALGLAKELERASEKKIRAGKGKTRGRKYKRRKGVLVVLSNKEALKAFRNIQGVDAELVENLNVELLAPGGQAGRLTVFSENALKKLDKVCGLNGS